MRRNGDGNSTSLSQAGGTSDAWGNPTQEPQGDPLHIDEAERYERGLEIGRGGMGRVLVARDRRLCRQVALKEVRTGVNQEAAAAQILAEAQITAALDHPGIVAIHDVGRDSRGQPFYTMRLIRGQTLSQARSTLPQSQRRQLLPALLAACHAVAHAHERGIVHRDLKPDNLLVGPHGETQVLDWGLSCRVADAERGGVVGTVGFMAPEVSEGGGASPRSDVYSLGATLLSVLVDPGERDLEGPQGESVLPKELAAIAARCLAKDPLQRYPDAGALAEDLSAWLDGRRVAAYRYSPWQLLGRVVLAFRLPLLVAGVALVIIAGVFWQGWRRTLAQRDLAVSLEATARSALALANQAQGTAQRRLGSAYLHAAETLVATGARPEAETLAAEALTLGEAPAARGLLSRHPEGATAELLSDHPLPACHKVRLSPEGTWVLCVLEEAVVCFSADGQRLWRVPGLFVDAAVSTAAGRAVLVGHNYEATVVELSSGQVSRSGHPIFGQLVLAQRGTPWVAIYNYGAVALWDLATLEEHPFGDLSTREDGFVTAAFANEPGALVLASRFGRLVRLGPGQKPQREDWVPRRSALELGRAGGEVSALAVGESGQIILGTRRGRLWINEGATGREILGWSGEMRRVQPSVASLVRGPSGQLAAFGEGAGITVWPSLAEPPLRLPKAERLALAFVDPTTVVVAGSRLRRYTLRPRKHPGRFVGEAGFSEAALSPDGQLLATGAGDGTLRVFDTRTGALATSLRLSPAVIKSVAFSPDGQRLAVGLAASPGFVVLQVGSFVSLPVDRRVTIKSLGYFDNGTLWRNTYGEGFDVLPNETATTPLWRCGEGCSQGLTGANASRTALVYVLFSGEMRLIRANAPTQPWVLQRLPRIGAVALGADMKTIAVAEGGRVRLLDVARKDFVRELIPSGPLVRHLAFAPDDSLLFVAEQEPSVRVFRVSDGVEIAVLRGHSQRVSQVLFGREPLRILTVSWDGVIQSWDWRRLLLDASALRDEVGRLNGLHPEEALHTVAF